MLSSEDQSTYSLQNWLLAFSMFCRFDDVLRYDMEITNATISLYFSLFMPVGPSTAQTWTAKNISK